MKHFAVFQGAASGTVRIEMSRVVAIEECPAGLKITLDTDQEFVVQGNAGTARGACEEYARTMRGASERRAIGGQETR